MTFSFKPAVREQTPLLIGIAGPSGSGKTFSALRLATGIAGKNGKIAGIDTERRRMLHYADKFDFLHGELGAPFRPTRYLEALDAAQKAGVKVAIVDSTSHAHEGPGGVLEWHEEELTRMAGDNFGRREAMKFSAWIKPKADANKFVNGILQLGIHVIFCFRAKEKLALVRNEKGRIEPTPMGWQAICTDRMEYEMTCLLMLPPNAGGVPDLTAKPTKLQEQHQPFVPAGKPIDEAMGQRFAEWAEGGSPAPKRIDAEALLDEGRRVARGGTGALQAWWKSLSADHRKAAGGNGRCPDHLKEAAADADAAHAHQEDPDASEPLHAPYGEDDDTDTTTDMFTGEARRDWHVSFKSAAQYLSEFPALLNAAIDAGEFPAFEQANRSIVSRLHSMKDAGPDVASEIGELLDAARKEAANA